MTLEKLSNWWDTPGLGELSMAAGSVPAAFGTYVVSRDLLNFNPRAAAAAASLIGGKQVLDNILQARKNGQSGTITPSSPISDIAKSAFTGGVGVLAGAGLSSIAKTGPLVPKNMAIIGGLLAAGDYARRRGRAAIERRSYDHELNRQIEEYNKEAQVAWYGHKKLSGSLLTIKTSILADRVSPALDDYGMEESSSGRIAPAPLVAGPETSRPAPRPSAMQTAAARAAANAMASGVAGAGAAAAASSSQLASSRTPQTDRPQNRPVTSRPAAAPVNPAVTGSAPAAAAAGASAAGGFGGALQRMIQAIPSGAAGKPIPTNKPQSGSANPGASAQQDPKVTAYLINKKKDLATAAYLMDKKKDLATAEAQGVEEPMKDETRRRYKPNAEGSESDRTKLPAGLTGAMLANTNMPATAASAEGGFGGALQRSTNPLRNITNLF